MKEHRPPHIYTSDQIYFVTSRTYKDIKYFDDNDKKGLLEKVLKISIEKFNIAFYAYVILDNHYHLLCRIRNKQDLPKFAQNLHQNSSRLLRRGLSSATPGREDIPVWYQYWDKCINSEKDFFVHFNYIHHNPIKHGYKKNLHQLPDYKFSSYASWLKSHGREFLDNILMDYPISDSYFE
ncbi:transposase [Patescibacteria group bacterium]|nr:transposase [Patescibacteria group bacterium]MBU1922254.1 transposase [Patescibacteria group bacterium]